MFRPIDVATLRKHRADALQRHNTSPFTSAVAVQIEARIGEMRVNGGADTPLLGPGPPQTAGDRKTRKGALEAFGSLPRVDTFPPKGTAIRVVCERQPRGALAQVNGMWGTVTGASGRWVHLSVCVDGELQDHRTTSANLRRLAGVA